MLAGAGVWPPEDCCGTWGYADLKEILAEPSQEELESMLEWVGIDSAADFDPAQFGLGKAKRRLQTLTTP